MAARTLIALAALALAGGATACSDSSAPAGGPPAVSCAAGGPGVQAALQSDQPFTASDVEQLRRRLVAAAESCAVIGPPGAAALSVKLPGMTRDRAALLLSPGRLSFDTWTAASGPITAPPAGVAAAFVPLNEGGTCAGSTATTQCIPSGFVPRPTGVAGAMITSARMTSDPTTKQNSLLLTLSDAGTTLLANVTANMSTAAAPLNQLAIFLDDVLIDNANVESPLNNGEVQVGGGRIDADPNYGPDIAAVVGNQVRVFTAASITENK